MITLPWFDFLGMFLMMTGFIFGLGSVTVIELHAWMGRNSEYWTEASTRTHKVTKPLIWFGIFLACLGALIVYREIGLRGIPLLQLIILVPLALNGAWLTSAVSPYLLHQEEKGFAQKLLPESLQMKVMVSFLFSFVVWWLELLLFVSYLVTQR